MQGPLAHASEQSETSTYSLQLMQNLEDLDISKYWAKKKNKNVVASTQPVEITC